MAVLLTNEMRDALASALADGFPVMSASAYGSGQPSLAYFGTAQVFDSERLAVWVRNPQAGFLRRIAENPQVALLYRNPRTRTSWQFHGLARVSVDDAVRRAVFDSSPEVERNLDPERAGVAVLVEVVRILQRGQVIAGEPLDFGD
jgi:hypothetical protein